MQLLAGALHGQKVLNTRDKYQLLQQMTCSIDKPDCLLRRCTACKDQTVMQPVDTTPRSLTYYSWCVVTSNTGSSSTQCVPVGEYYNENYTCTCIVYNSFLPLCSTAGSTLISNAHLRLYECRMFCFCNFLENC